MISKLDRQFHIDTQGGDKIGIATTSHTQEQKILLCLLLHLV